jgi:hypothetical protein
VADAATAIVGLINSQPRSPRPDEIEAIIACVAAPSLPLLRRGDAARERFESGEDLDDEASGTWTTALLKRTKRRARTFADLQLFIPANCGDCLRSPTLKIRPGMCSLSRSAQRGGLRPIEGEQRTMAYVPALLTEIAAREREALTDLTTNGARELTSSV